MSYSVGVIIISDRAASGERPDGCLPVFRDKLTGTDYNLVTEKIVSDDPDEIKEALENMIRQKLSLIFTSGGTGCGPRDNTPEVTRAILEKPTPGLDEAIRNFSAQKSRNAIFSRAVSGVASLSFIVNLPGSPKAVAEILEFLMPRIEHPLKLINRQITDCALEDRRSD